MGFTPFIIIGGTHDARLSPDVNKVCNGTILDLSPNGEDYVRRGWFNGNSSRRVRPKVGEVDPREYVTCWMYWNDPIELYSMFHLNS